MFNFGNCCGDGCGDNGTWSCLINLITMFVIMEFLCNILGGNNGLNCGSCC